MDASTGDSLLKDEEEIGLRARPPHALVVGDDEHAQPSRPSRTSDARDPLDSRADDDPELNGFGFFQKGRDFESYDTNHIWTAKEKVSPLTAPHYPLPL